MRFLFQILVMMFFTTQILADTIALKNGDIFSGTIIGASEEHIILQKKNGKMTVSQTDVLSLVFDNADMVFMKMGDPTKCKIIRKIGYDIILVTSSGIATIRNEDIKNVKYNSSDELKVDSLPPTGKQFINKPNKSVVTGNFQRNVYGRFNLASHYASLTDWKNQFYTTNGKHPSTNGLIFGGEIGVSVSRNFSIGAGYEYFSLPQLKITQTYPQYKDKVSYYFPFLSLKMGSFTSQYSNIFVFGTFDLGFLSGKEEIEDLEGVDFEAKSTALSPRIRFGCSYFQKNFELIAEIGYLFGHLKDIDLLGQNISDYTLNFSGLSLISGFCYHFPLI